MDLSPGSSIPAHRSGAVRERDRSIGRTNRSVGPANFLRQIAETNAKTERLDFAASRKLFGWRCPYSKSCDWRTIRPTTWHLARRNMHWRNRGAWGSEAEFSDGTLRLLGLLWALLDGRGPLPPGGARALVASRCGSVFRRNAGSDSERGVHRRQVFLRPHSTELLADPGIGLDEVLLLSGVEGTQESLASDSQKIRALLEGGLTMGDAVLPWTAPSDAAESALFPVRNETVGHRRGRGTIDEAVDAIAGTDGLQVGVCHVTRGQARLLLQLPCFNNAARFSPWSCDRPGRWR